MTWQEFVLANGWQARDRWVALITGQSVESIRRLKLQRACTRLPKRLDFGELFARWHGRPPAPNEWPLPERAGRGEYEWLQPELALLATLVGTMSVDEMAAALTERLRRVTGDPTARRNRTAVQNRINNHLGLEAGTDLIGGITTREAARRVGSSAIINQAIFARKLRTFRVGKRHVIPEAEFERWLSTRETPPKGWIRLASLMDPLGIKSDAKLPEYASLGHIPDVKLVKGIGTSRGLWYIDPRRAEQILEDAKAGRPLPWHGKPLPVNQQAMWRKWQARKHRRCTRCAEIWKGRAPATFEDFCARYADLTIGEKRHLTRPQRRTSARPSRQYGSCWTHRDAGVTVYEAAQLIDRRSRWIRMWIREGLFQWGGLVRDELGGEAIRITPLGICILKAAALDENARAMRQVLGMGLHAAAQHCGVSIGTIQAWQAAGEVLARPGARGLVYERSSLETRARRYWTSEVRFKRAQPPSWLQPDVAA